MSRPKTKIYTAKSYLPAGKHPTILLYPFWEHPQSTPDDPDHGRFDDYIRHGEQVFEITDDPASAAVFLLPFDFSPDERSIAIATELTDTAKAYGKRLMIFINSDLDFDVPLDNVVVFRTSLYKSRQKPHEFAFPGW